MTTSPTHRPRSTTALRRALVALAPLALLLLTIAPRLAVAAGAPAGDYAPYTGATGSEEVSAPLFVIIAYSTIWAIVLGFVISVWRRQRRVEGELEALRRQLDASGPGAGGAR